MTAKAMTQGRGRHGSTWLSGEGNLNFTIFFSSNLTIINRLYLPFTISLALYDLVHSVVTTGAEIAIKWPNDIYIDGKKVAGILIETGIKANSRSPLYLNIGIGVNVISYPAIAGRETTALSLYSQQTLRAEKMIEPLREKILFWLDQVNEYEWGELKHLWLKKAYNFGKEISTTYQDKKITGIFKDIGKRGELIMSLSNGDEVYINSAIIEEA